MATLSIPAFHVSDLSKAKGSGEVFIQSRKDAVSSGIFNLKLEVHFDPTVDDYPVGSLIIRVDLSDGSKGTFTATSIELINSYGKHNPTICLTGRCSDDAQPDARGCRYWVMIANNKAANVPITQGTPDIAGFAIHDRNGNRIAYGCGPVRAGDFDIMPK
jgi:hypothetical protein